MLDNNYKDFLLYKLLIAKPMLIFFTAPISLLPTWVVTIPGETSLFECRSSRAVEQFQWLVNGDINQTDGIMTRDLNEHLSFLNFNNISVEYNGTIIRCIVTHTSGEIIISNNATLLVHY